MIKTRFFYSLTQVKENKIKYILSIGKRQPMHIGHKKSLERILAIEEITLIYVMGSVNTGHDPLFTPFINPLNLEQQIEQFKQVFHKQNVIFIPILDVADMSKWGPSMLEHLAEHNINPQDCAVHFIGKPEDKLKETCSFLLPNNTQVTLEPGRWLIEALAYYDIAIWFDNEIEVNLDISARNLRELDLEHLSEDERNQLAAPDYLLEITRQARNASSTGPVTLKDLSLKRIETETNIPKAFQKGA